MKTLQDTRGRNGFTLTELLTTVATIGVVASLLLPALGKAKNKARDVQCLNNQRMYVMHAQSARDEILSDGSNRNPTAVEVKEINELYTRDYTGPLVPDPYFQAFGVRYMRNLTCPFALGDGTKRAFFFRTPVPFLTREENGMAHLYAFGKTNFVTFTYVTDTSLSFLRTEREQAAGPAIWEVYNTPGKSYTVNVGYLFPGVQSERPVTIDNTLMHSHKGVGGFTTYGTGEQKWEKLSL